MKKFIFLMNMFFLSFAQGKEVFAPTPAMEFLLLPNMLITFVFSALVTWLALRGRKISTFLLALYLSYIFNLLFIYIFLQPVFKVESIYIMFIISKLNFVVTFFVLWKIDFLKDFTWFSKAIPEEKL